MSFFAGFLEEWNRIDDVKQRREEFEREMTLRAQTMMWPQILEELTALNQIKAARTEKFATAKELGLSLEGALVLEDSGKLDTFLRDAGSAKDQEGVRRFVAQWESQLKDATESDNDFATAVEALVTTYKKEGADVDPRITWAAVAASLMGAKSPEEVLDYSAQLAERLGVSRHEAKQILTGQIKDNPMVYNSGDLTSYSNLDRKSVSDYFEDKMKDRSGMMVQGVWQVKDPVGFSQLIGSMTDKALDLATREEYDLNDAMSIVERDVNTLYETYKIKDYSTAHEALFTDKGIAGLELIDAPSAETQATQPVNGAQANGAPMTSPQVDPTITEVEGLSGITNLAEDARKAGVTSGIDGTEYVKPPTTDDEWFELYSLNNRNK